MLLFYPFAWIFDRLRYEKVDSEITSTNGRTIVIVERWLNSNVFHHRWVDYLQRQGFTVHLVSLSLAKGTFDESAIILKIYIDGHNLTDITLVGVSSGGISCFLYLQKYNGWTKVRRFISVATPFQGTVWIWPLFFIKSCRELIPNSSFLRNLLEQKIEHVDKIICITGKIDELVPLSSQSLPGAKREALNIWGHNNMHLYSKKTWDLIARYAME